MCDRQTDRIVMAKMRSKQ